MKEQYHKQFSGPRLALLFGSTALVLAWMFMLQYRWAPPVGKDGQPPVPPTAEAWAPWWPAAIITVVVCTAIAVLAAFLTVRRTRRLPEEERDWEGPDPHADRQIPAEAWSPSPIMQAAIKRTISKQEG